MKTIWRILQFAPLIAIFGVLGLFGFYAYGMTRANITQSDGFTAITPEAVDSTLSGALPETAIRIRHCYVSVGVAVGFNSTDLVPQSKNYMNTQRQSLLLIGTTRFRR